MIRWFDLRWSTVLVWTALCLIGLVAIYSSTQGPVAQFLPKAIQGNFLRQSLWMLLSVGVLFAVQLVNPRFFQDGAYVIYAGGILLMVATLLFGTEVNGAKSWLRFGPANMQPSEFMKLATILAAAAYLSSERTITAEKPRHVFTVTMLFLVPIVLIILQNDLGTAIVFAGILPILLFWSGLPIAVMLLILLPAIVGYLTLLNLWAGITGLIVLSVVILFLQKRRWLFVSAAAVGAGVILMLEFGLELALQPHQILRIQAFLNPETDPHGAGWNVLQAKTAIGSGGLLGKGFMQGTQTQLRFLPEQWTDFVFCVIGEEFGFLGATVVVLLFLTLFLGFVSMMLSHKHPFAQLVFAGVLGVYFLHFLINTGSALGILPVIGIPLPFVSYGGSALVMNSLMLGICLNLDLYKREFSIYR